MEPQPRKAAQSRAKRRLVPGTWRVWQALGVPIDGGQARVRRWPSTRLAAGARAWETRKLASGERLWMWWATGPLGRDLGEGSAPTRDEAMAAADAALVRAGYNAQP